MICLTSMTYVTYIIYMLSNKLDLHSSYDLNKSHLYKLSWLENIKKLIKHVFHIFFFI